VAAPYSIQMKNNQTKTRSCRRKGKTNDKDRNYE
jgi:hypothetical protein